MYSTAMSLNPDRCEAALRRLRIGIIRDGDDIRGREIHPAYSGEKTPYARRPVHSIQDRLRFLVQNPAVARRVVPVQPQPLVQALEQVPQKFAREWTKLPDFQQAKLASLSPQTVHRLANGTTHTAHRDEHLVGILTTIGFNTSMLFAAADPGPLGSDTFCQNPGLV